MKDEVIIIPNENNIINVEEEDNSIKHEETVEVVNVASAEPIYVDSQEAFPALGEDNTELSHPKLYGRDNPNQHPIIAITGLREELDNIEAVKRVYSSENGLGEFRKWNDNNPKGEDRSGYFVTIVPGTDNIEICDNTHDVYGISVSRSGFVGNQNDFDKSDDYSYVIVGIVGAMRVRTDGTARNGEYVVPNAYGEATLSENKYGYKVLSQGSYPSYNYVTIAITPQSDALSRLQESIAGGDLSDILIHIDRIDGELGDLQIKVDASDKDIEDILSDLEGLQVQITDATDVSNAAKESADAAKASASKAISSATQAQLDAQDARESAVNAANQAISEVSELKSQMEPIVSWTSEDGISSGAGGFVNQANEDHVIISSIVTGTGPSGSNIAAILQKADENGAIIQHLVSHVDKYIVGDTSLSDGLTHDEAKSILTEEYIYVPTDTHSETMANNPDVVIDFTRGYYYTWDVDNGIWIESSDTVSTATVYNDGTNVGDLWYCWQDVVIEDEDGTVIETYIAGTLYRWFGNKWVAVATISDNYRGRILTSIKQTADSIKSDVVSLRGDVTTVEQNVDSITTRVGTAEGNISTINQEVGEIQSTIATIDGTISSLQQHADEADASITAIALGRFPIVYQSFLGTPPSPYDNGNRYTIPPVWDDESGSFIFSTSSVADDGDYYFISEDCTKYCYVTENGYDIYTIGKKATASLDNRISDAEASISALVEFETDTTNSLANLSNRADENEANITALATRYHHILLSVSEDEVPICGEYKYTQAPEWNAATGQYEFNIDNRSDTGTYYMADENNQTYCKVVTTDDDTVLYEVYGLSGSSLAAVQQKVDDNSSSIYLVAHRILPVITLDGRLSDNALLSKSSIIIQAINDESIAQIEADRVNIAASKVFSAIVSNGEITPASIVAAINNSTSEVSISANKVNLAASDMFSAVVSSDGVITPASIIAAINADESGIKISADKVDLVASKMFSAIVGSDGTITPASIILSINNDTSDAQISADRINLSASEMFSAVVDSGGNITPASIVASINNSESEVKISASHVEVSADNIDLSASSLFRAVVGSDGNVTPASIVAAINESGSSVVIEANKINLNGELIIAAINGTDGATTINGSYITTGSITADQIASSTITADQIAAGTITANEIATGSITADKINLKGITITNTSGDITFAVSEYGEVTINGNVDSVIQLANGTYSGGSFIDGHTIQSPEIVTETLNIYTSSSEGRLFNIYATYYSSLYSVFSINYSDPYVVLTTPFAGAMKMDADETYFTQSVYFQGSVDFTTATVTGLFAKFG